MLDNATLRRVTLDVMLLNKTLALLVLALFIQGCGQSAPTNSVDSDDEHKASEASPAADPTSIGPIGSISKKPANGKQETYVHTTPQECYWTMVKAAETEDFETLLSCFSVTDRNQQVGWVAYHVEREVFFQTEKRDAATALLKKYGLDKMDIMGLMQIYDSPGGKGVAKAVELVGKRVKDQPRFMTEASALLKPRTDDSSPDDPTRKQTPVLSDVAIDGDRASATSQLPGSDESAPVFFKKENGSWVMTSEPTKKESQ